jgi:hypothetical protein
MNRPQIFSVTSSAWMKATRETRRSSATRVFSRVSAHRELWLMCIRVAKSRGDSRSARAIKNGAGDNRAVFEADGTSGQYQP